MLKLGLEMDKYKSHFVSGKVELQLSDDDKKTIDQVNGDVLSSQMVKFEYLILHALNDAGNAKSKGRVEKYVTNSASFGKKPWQQLLNKELVVKTAEYLGLPVDSPADAGRPASEAGTDATTAAVKGGKKEKKEKKEKKDNKDGDDKEKKEKKDKKEKKENKGDKKAAVKKDGKVKK